MKPSRRLLIEVLSFLGIAIFLAEVGIPAYLAANRAAERMGGSFGGLGWLGLLAVVVLLGVIVMGLAWLASIAPFWLIATLVESTRRRRRTIPEPLEQTLPGSNNANQAPSTPLPKNDSASATT